MPTLCDIAGIKTPEGADGISYLPELTGKRQLKHEYLYWEFPESGGQQAVIIGNFKAMRKNLRKENSEFELYDLLKDKEEITNVASLHPEILEKVDIIIKNEHKKSGNERWVLKALDDQ
jgi:arylsulfatase